MVSSVGCELTLLGCSLAQFGAKSFFSPVCDGNRLDRGRGSSMTSHDNPENLFATPLHVTNLDDCYFYHTTDLPGLRLIEGEWDLTRATDAYLGFTDKQVALIFAGVSGNSVFLVFYIINFVKFKLCNGI